MQDVLLKASEAANFISEKISTKPTLGIVLGSGLGGFAEEVKEERVEIPYEEIPNFPKPSVQGHAGNLIIGKIYDKDVVIMQGRFHYYEGHELSDVTFPIVVLALLGVTNLIITNAAGAISQKLSPTDLMLITDHINFANISPLRGINNGELLGDMFPSMNEAYSKELINIAKEAAAAKEYAAKKETKEGAKIELKEGVYAYMTGPQYETPAEVKMLSILGADAVGMSTVPEVIMANQLGMNVLGISCITNTAASEQEPSHEEVLENVDKASEEFEQLLMRIIWKI